VKYSGIINRSQEKSTKRLDRLRADLYTRAVNGEPEPDMMPTGSDDASSFVTTEPSWSRAAKTITLKLDDEGNLKPLSDRMQSRLREFASREDWKTATGLDNKSSNVVTDKSTVNVSLELMDEAKAKDILKWLEQTKQMLWGMAGLSETKRTELCLYSEEQKNLIAPSLAAVANKRAPDWLRKYWPEVQLLLFMGSIEVGQFQMCAKSLMEERRSKSQHRPTMVPPTPIREQRTEVRREPVASAEARAEVQRSIGLCHCGEPVVPSLSVCRYHRTEAAEA
jgi:hypothetical protein